MLVAAAVVQVRLVEMVLFQLLETAVQEALHQLLEHQ
jgi:hypothetical protein